MKAELNTIERARLILDIIVVFDLFLITILAIASLLVLTKISDKQEHLITIFEHQKTIFISNAKE